MNVTKLLCVLLAGFGAGACHSPRCPDTSPRPPEAGAPVAAPRGSAGLRVFGLVQRPVEVTAATWSRYAPVTVRLNDVHRNGDYHGNFMYRGVPLRTLLDEARIAKPAAALFNREMDLAIVVRSRSGEAAVISWGEAFYKNPEEVVLAFAATPIVPHKDCRSCHDEATYRSRRDELDRAVAFPKLVVSRDFHTDRSIEDVVEIEVADIGAEAGIHAAKKDKPAKLRAEEIAIHGAAAEPVIRRDFSGLARHAVEVIMAGEGIGYHGTRRYEGVSLRDALVEAGVAPDPSGALLLSAPDGYRVLLSNAEVFAVRSGREIVLADVEDGNPIDDGGRFHLVLPDDFAADRWLKSVARIDVLRASAAPGS